MDHKQMCVANVQYKKPTPDDTKRAKNLLRYLTYRDGRIGYIKQVSGKDRWEDHGLGGSIAEITRRCDAYRSDHVLVFSLVYNPNPDLLTMVAPQDRERFVRELSIQTTEDFFDARGTDTGIEYSFVLHHRPSEDPQAPGLPDPHTHVILPGTYFDEGEGRRVPLFFSRNKQVNHIELLHQTTERNMVDLMDRYVGPDWERRYDALEVVREQQRQVIEHEPDGEFIDEEGQAWPVWAGVRRMMEECSAAGIYRYFPSDDGPRLEFRPLIQFLDHGDADIVAQAFAEQMRTYPDPSLPTLENFAWQLVHAAQGNTTMNLDVHQPEGPSFDL